MTLLAGRYRLLSQLGQGGMGIVWRAHDELLRQEVAVKEVRLPPDLGEAARAELAGRTLREARAAARLRSHPSIVTVHDVVLDGGRPWIVMELVRGRALDRILRDGGPLPPRQVAWIGLRMLDALGAAHAAGVLHRDVKPGNVLLTDDGRALLTDFGIATVAGDAAITQTGLLTGSPGYIAPERLRGEADGPPADLWSLGATLFTAVEGAPPFARPNAAAVMAAVLMREPAPARLAGPLAPVLAALLEKDPVRRCTPAQAADRLTAIAQGTPGGARDREGTAPGALPRRGRTPVVLAAVLVALLAAAAGVVVLVNAAPDVTTATGSTLTPRPTSSPASSKASASPARALFARDFEACDLLTAAQARTLLGGPAKRQFQTAFSCAWNRPDGTFLNVSANRLADTSTARAAQRQTAENMRDEPRRVPGTRLRKGPEIGDEAYSYTRGETIVGAPIYRTQISLRVSNVWVVVFHTGRRPGYATADRTARLVVTAIEKYR